MNKNWYFCIAVGDTRAQVWGSENPQESAQLHADYWKFEEGRVINVFFMKDDIWGEPEATFIIDGNGKAVQLKESLNR